MRSEIPPSLPRPEIRRLFGRIAPRYDLLNSLLSIGQHHRWARLAADAARIGPGDLVLDVAAGTGELALALAARRAHVVALDFAPEMIAAGRTRTAGRTVCYVQGDALSLPFPDARFAAATIGFTLRNVASRARLFSEMARVVRPGGWVISLETSQPPNRALRAAYHAYLSAAARLAPLLSEGAAYRYFARSVAAFADAEVIASELRAAGLHEVSFRRLLLGVVAIHAGRVGEHPGRAGFSPPNA
jgi:demethylmenaquinone methyltransferase/2-methoxy-6-polyprenyl-1,4-benzoquinol methylase